MIQSVTRRHLSLVDQTRVTEAHVAVLTNYLTPHHWKQLQAASQRVNRMSVLLSTEMEPNRNWTPDWGMLDVQVQKNVMLTRKWRHKAGFEEDNYVHIPWDTIKRLRQLKPDIIISYEMGMRTLFSSMYRSMHDDCRLIMVANVSEHTEQGRGALRPWLRRYLKTHVDFVTYNGPSCKRYLLDQGHDENKLVYFPYQHDVAKVWSGEHDFDTLPSRLFFCGSLSDRKGIVRFTNALATWCRENPDRQIELVIGGDGPLRMVIETMHRPGNLTLTLLGPIDTNTIRECYGSCDVTVFPTFADEWGMVVNESLGSGTPILSSCYAQSTEALVRDDRNGWIFDPRNQQSVRHGLDRALNTPTSLMKQMSHDARESVCHLTPDYNADLFQRLVQQALQSQTRSRPLTSIS